MVNEYSYTPLYYDAPTQVRYWNDGIYCGGIAIHDVIIQGHNGELVAIQTIIDQAESDGVHWDKAVIELSWNDIDSIILN